MEELRLQKKLIRIAKRTGADLGALDTLVVDAKCIQANRINNCGIEAQIKFLFGLYGYKQVKRWMLRETKLIRKHNSSKGMTQLQKLKDNREMTNKETIVKTAKRLKKHYPKKGKRRL